MAKSGLITGIAAGLGVLVITIIMIFVFIENAEPVDDGFAIAVQGTSVGNETVVNVDETGYTLVESAKTGFVGSVTEVWGNYSTTPYLIPDTNYTLTGGTLTNASLIPDVIGYADASVSYSFTYTPSEGAADRMITNFTSGIDEVSTKVPTILKIAAVVLLFGVLMLLWDVYQRMNLGGGTGSAL